MQRILLKAEQLLTLAAPAMQEAAAAHHSVCSPALVRAGVKLSRGANYRQLPYRVLDFPRHFGPDGFFAIRSMFWWGNFFSSTLLLSGAYKIAYTEPLVTALPMLREEGYYTCVAEDPWQHSFEPTNYRSLQEYSDAAIVQHWQQHPFLKLAKKIPLQQWETATEWFAANFKSILAMLDNQLPSR